jgi:hypothetical protein
VWVTVSIVQISSLLEACFIELETPTGELHHYDELLVKKVAA